MDRFTIESQAFVVYYSLEGTHTYSWRETLEHLLYCTYLGIPSKMQVTRTLKSDTYVIIQIPQFMWTVL